MGIGQDLLDVPFADFLHHLGLGVAEAQLELDRSAIQTLKFLVNTNETFITDITDIITSDPRTVSVDGQNVAYTGAKVQSGPSGQVTMSLLQAGITPTFYQFTESTVEVKLSITVTESSKPSAKRLPTKLSIRATPVDARVSNTYSYSASGASTFRAILRPVPPPSRLVPRVTTVDATVQPPRINITNA